MCVLSRVKWVWLILATACLPVLNYAQDGANDLTLAQAVARALEVNPNVLAAQEEVRAAQGRAWPTWWLADPIFAAEFSEIPTGHGLDAFNERKLSLSQAIDFPLNMYFKNRLAGRRVQVSRMQLAQTQLAVRVAVKQAYLNLQAKQELADLSQQSLQLAQTFLAKAQTRYDVGEAPKLEIVRATVAAAQAENELTQSQNALRAAQVTLNRRLGRPVESEVILTDSLIFRPFDLALAELKQQALATHPRLQTANGEVGAAQQVRNLAWGGFLPVIEASAFRQSVDGNSDLYGVEFGLSIPLWFPVRQRGQIQAAGAELNAAQHRRQAEALALASEIERAYHTVQSGQKQVGEYRTTLLHQADEFYRIALRSYEEGEAGYLELLEAQKTLVEVRVGYIDALTDFRLALLELEGATGLEIDQ